MLAIKKTLLNYFRKEYLENKRIYLIMMFNAHTKRINEDSANNSPIKFSIYKSFECIPLFDKNFKKWTRFQPIVTTEAETLEARILSTFLFSVILIINLDQVFSFI
jgi:hypothetical protein